MRKYYKRITLFFGGALIATLVSLAFIPHYGCACGETLKQNGTQLEYLPQTIAKFFIEIIRAIF